jgi:hypothetical protein
VIIAFICFFAPSAIASDCKLKFKDKSAAIELGVHPSRINTLFMPAGRYYDPRNGQVYYQWMGGHIEASKVTIVGGKKSCNNLSTVRTE